MAKGAIAFVTVLLAALILIAAPELPQLPYPPALQCDDQGRADDQDCRALAVVTAVVRRVVDFIDEHANIFIVLGTLAIAWFTFTLWQSTHRLWQTSENQIGVARTSAETALKGAQATELAARNARLSHRPFLTLIDLKLAPFAGAVKPRMVLRDDGEEGALVSVIGSFENRGESLCRLQGASFLGDIGTKAKTMPGVYSPEIFGHTIVGAGSIYIPSLPLCFVPVPESVRTSQDNRTIFVCGWFRYSDLYGIVRRQHVAYEFYKPLSGDIFDDTTGGFVECGPAEFWVEVEENPDDA